MLVLYSVMNVSLFYKSTCRDQEAWQRRLEEFKAEGSCNFRWDLSGWDFSITFPSLEGKGYLNKKPYLMSSRSVSYAPRHWLGKKLVEPVLTAMCNPISALGSVQIIPLLVHVVLVRLKVSTRMYGQFSGLLENFSILCVMWTPTFNMNPTNWRLTNCGWYAPELIGTWKQRGYFWAKSLMVDYRKIPFPQRIRGSGDF